MASNYSRIIEHNRHNLVFHTLQKEFDSISIGLSFFIILKGSGQISAKKYRQGDLVACFPGSYIALSPEDETHAIHLFPDKDLLETLNSRELFSLYLIDCEHAKADMLSTCSTCFQELVHSKASTPLIDAPIKSLITRVIDFLDKDYLCLEEVVGNKNNDPFVLDFFEKANLKKSSSSIAEEMNLSASHLNRKLKEKALCSPNRYIQLLKLYTVIENYSGDSSFTSLAHDKGYSDQSHFIKSFKRFLGATPKKFFP